MPRPAFNPRLGSRTAWCRCPGLGRVIVWYIAQRRRPTTQCTAPRRERPRRNQNSMTTGRLLVVDDDVVVREMFADALRLEGHTVRTAATAAAALNEVVLWRPDAILLDYRMGLITGVGFLYRLRAHETAAHTPVAVITGRVDLEETLATECATLGAAIYFKPLRLEDLRAIARGLLTKIIH